MQRPPLATVGLSEGMPVAELTATYVDKIDCIAAAKAKKG